jgi:hypothetical protein
MLKQTVSGRSGGSSSTAWTNNGVDALTMSSGRQNEERWSDAIIAVQKKNMNDDNQRAAVNFCFHLVFFSVRRVSRKRMSQQSGTAPLAMEARSEELLHESKRDEDYQRDIFDWFGKRR